MDRSLEQAREFFLRGLAHYQGGRLAQAERDFAAALDLVPGRVSTLTNLGAVRLKLGRLDDAVALLQEAIAHEPDNVEALSHLAAAQAELGQLAAALEHAERAVRLQPQVGAVWMLRGSILRTIGHLPAAIESFRQAAAHGADSELNRYYLAALGGGEAPRAPPRVYVESLFDSYAHEFDAHLVQDLHYRAPDILVAGLRPNGQRMRAALDLGCGTGICGRLLRPLTDRLDGVDMSHSMVERARAAGCYDEVAQSDIAEFLHATPRRYDLVLAADVFIYVGALEGVFAGVARMTDPGARFCFSVEIAPPGADLVLQPSLRYAHSAGYIRKLAEPHGFEISATAEHPIREDQGLPIPGLFAWLVRT